MMKSVWMVLAAAIGPNVAMAQVEVHLTVPEVRVRVAPPPTRVEVQPERQSPDQQWIPGHWAWRDNQNIWISGVWTRPPQEGMTWEKERWEQRNGAWYFAEGHWRWANPATPTTVYVPSRTRDEVASEQAPPRIIVERRPRPPFRGAVWINGYWDWDGSHHAWVAGRWSARPARSVWTPDRWRRARGDGHDRRSRWVLVPGHWDRR